MQSKKLARIIALILVFVLVLTFLISAVSYVAVAAPSEDEIERLVTENEELSQKIIEVESQVNSFEFDNLSLLEKKAMLDRLVILTDAVIANLYAQIDTYDLLAVELEDDLLVAEEYEAEQRASAVNRIRAYEENGILAYISPAFEARNFAEFLGRIEFLGIVFEYDSQVFSVYSEAKEQTALINAKIDGIDAEKARIRRIIAEKETERDKRASDAGDYLLEILGSWDTYEVVYAEVEQQQIEFEHTIASKTAEQIRVSPQIQPGSGVFYWPVRTSSTVILGYGTKLDSTYNIYRVHNGIDIGGDYGSEVIASDAGMVTASGYDSVYGNYVVLNHGNGYETLYAQLSVIFVDEGDQIEQGTVIGNIGATGYATEPHLHFEIRIDGESDNPLRFFSGYTVR